MLWTANSVLQPAQVTFVNGPKPECNKSGGAKLSFATDLTLEESSELTGRSFSGTEKVRGEPAFSWIFDQISFANRQERTDTITFMVANDINESLCKKGAVFAIRADEKAVGNVIIREYDPAMEGWFWDSFKGSMRGFLFAMRALLSGQLPTFFTDQNYKQECSALQKWAESVRENQLRYHKQLGPDHKHWDYRIVAVDPEWQGKGIGSAIMRRTTELADAAGVDSVVEASDENVGWYEKFGFKVEGKWKINGLTDEVGHKYTHVMVRCHQQQP